MAQNGPPNGVSTASGGMSLPMFMSMMQQQQQQPGTFVVPTAENQMMLPNGMMIPVAMMMPPINMQLPVANAGGAPLTPVAVQQQQPFSPPPPTAAASAAAAASTGVEDMPLVVQQYVANPSDVLDLGAEYSKKEYHEKLKVYKTTPGIPDKYGTCKAFRPKLFRWVRNTRTIRDLRLVGCNIGDTTLKTNVLKALQDNASITRVDLTDNNISCRAMLTFVDRLEPYNYSIIELIFGEGSKKLEDKGSKVHDAWGPMLEDLVMNEPEPVLEKKVVLPRIEKFCEWNRRYCGQLLGASTLQATKLDLLFADRMKEKFLEFYKAPADIKVAVKPRPLRTDALDRLFASGHCKKLEELTFEHWFPPPPADHPYMKERHDNKLKKRIEQANKEYSTAETAEEREAANLRRPKHERQGLDKQIAFAKNYQVPSQLWNLISLKALKFYNLVRVDEWRDPTSNRKLRIASSFLKEIPSDITRLVNLTELVLSRAGLEKLSPSICATMVQLQNLGLPQNELKELPEQIGCLTRLTRLSVHSNRLVRIPDAILQLQNLRVLLAHHNYLTSLPTSIPQYLTNLVDIKAVVQRQHGSAATRPLSPAVSFLMKEEERAIGLKDSKTLALFRYLDEARRGLTRLNRCKLMLVGDGGIGKSKLAAAIALETQPKDLKKAKKKEKEQQKKLAKEEKKRGADDSIAAQTDDSTLLQTDDDDLDKRFTGIVNQATDGIDIHDIRISNIDVGGKATAFDEKGTIQFSCWDFAGQDVYYNTHTFFLSDRSIYLVGFNATHEQEKSFSRVEYWLQSITARLPGAPIVIFGTHCDDPKCTSSYLKSLEDKIKDKFKKFRFIDIIWIKNTNDTRSKSVQKLLKVLTKIVVSKNFKKRLGIDEECPISYYHLEERAKSRRANMVTPTLRWAVWAAIAETEFNMPEQNLIQATQYLHNLGSILWFNEDGLRDVIILDPQWLTQVFASLVSAKTPITNGVLRHETLPILWKTYPEAVWPFMLVVLEKFEVLHRLEGNALGNVSLSMRLLTDENNVMTNTAALAVLTSTASAGVVSGVNYGISLVPALLGEQAPSPADMERAWPTNEEETTELSRIYRFEFLPNGFFSRLMVRLLHSMWSANLFWKYGIVLSKDLAHIFLRFSPDTKELTLSVRGPDGSNKMGSLIDSIDTLIADWLKDVHKDIFIPIKLPGGKEHLVDVKSVLDSVASGNPTVQACGQVFRIDQIAPDLAMAGAVRGGNITEKDLNLERELGRGGFAIVYRGTLHGEPVAVKKLIFTPAQEESGETSFSEVFGEFRREVWLMSSMQHENIVSLKGVCTQPSLAMVLEFMEAGNLYDYLHNNKKGISWEEKLRLALDVASGMNFMHLQTPPIIHRDLKTPNILLTRRGGGPFPTAKIADFGLSRGLMWQSSFDKKVVDNPVWLAPEVLQRKPYSEKVDVYAFGVILWEIATQEDFFGELNFMSELESKIVSGERPALPKSFPPGYEFFGPLILACWAQDPSARPSFDECVRSLQAGSFDPNATRGGPKVKVYAAPEAPQIRLARSQSAAGPMASSPTPPMRQAAHSVANPSPLQRGLSTPIVSPAPPQVWKVQHSSAMANRAASSGTLMTPAPTSSVPPAPQEAPAPLNIQQYFTGNTQFMQPQFANMPGFMPFASPPQVASPPQPYGSSSSTQAPQGM